MHVMLKSHHSLLFFFLLQGIAQSLSTTQTTRLKSSPTSGSAPPCVPTETPFW